MQEVKRAVIIAGGNISDYGLISSLINDGDFIICADSGIMHCEKMGIKADLLVGDFDSCSREKAFSCFAANGAEKDILPSHKDDTDTEYAVDCAARRGFEEVLLIGATGTRADHMLSNIYLLEKAERLGISMSIADENNRISLLKNGEKVLTRGRFKYVSALPLDGCAEGVTCVGFKYPLNDETLYRFGSRGVSNELTGESGVFSVKRGTLLIIESKD